MPDIYNPSTHNKNSVEIYQLRIWLKRISPTIWRRILVRSDSSIADLHYIIQIAMGWSDSYLHQFVIHGKRYGIARDGGMWFLDNPNQLLLRNLHFHINQRFIYEYNFTTRSVDGTWAITIFANDSGG